MVTCASAPATCRATSSTTSGPAPRPTTLALLLAGARGLVPGVEAALASDSASWGGLHELFAAAARRSPAPELFEAGERLTRRRGLDQALLAGLLRDRIDGVIDISPFGCRTSTAVAAKRRRSNTDPPDTANTPRVS